MSILLVSNLFKCEISGEKDKARLIRLLPYFYLLTFLCMTSLAAINLFDVDKIGSKAIFYVLVIACGMSLIASYLSVSSSGIKYAASGKLSGNTAGYVEQVSWKLYELIACAPIAIMAIVSAVGFFSSQ